MKERPQTSTSQGGSLHHAHRHTDQTETHEDEGDHIGDLESTPIGTHQPRRVSYGMDETESEEYLQKGIEISIHRYPLTEEIVLGEDRGKCLQIDEFESAEHDEYRTHHLIHEVVRIDLRTVS